MVKKHVQIELSYYTYDELSKSLERLKTELLRGMQENKFRAGESITNYSSTYMEEEFERVLTPKRTNILPDGKIELIYESKMNKDV